MRQAMTCNKCKLTKPASDFYQSNLRACKECIKASVTARRNANLEKVREYDRQRGLLPHRKAANKARSIRYKEKRQEYTKRYTDKNPEKRTAHVITGNAIRDRKLIPSPCEKCGTGKNIHAHHEDYSKPLEVNWLCADCHGLRHREINKENRTAS